MAARCTLLVAVGPDAGKVLIVPGCIQTRADRISEVLDMLILMPDALTGFQTLELVKSKDVPGQNRGFCFVEFLNSACAAHAKNALSPPGYTYALD